MVKLGSPSGPVGVVGDGAGYDSIQGDICPKQLQAGK
jgi:hypothetical protein